jgi:hypothetical protein
MIQFLPKILIRDTGAETWAESSVGYAEVSGSFRKTPPDVPQE